MKKRDRSQTRREDANEASKPPRRAPIGSPKPRPRPNAADSIKPPRRAPARTHKPSPFPNAGRRAHDDRAVENDRDPHAGETDESGSRRTEGGSRRSDRGGSISPTRERRFGAPEPIAASAIGFDRLADFLIEILPEVEREVVHEKISLEHSLNYWFRRIRGLNALDRSVVFAAARALFRTRGWVDAIRADRFEERLLIALQLDSQTIGPLARTLARRLGKRGEDLIPLGDAPGWTERCEGLRHLAGGAPINADPWRLFPAGLRDHLMMPAGFGSAKARYLSFLETLQKPADLWVRALTEDPEIVWNELRRIGLRPWVHRRVTHAARLDRDVDLTNVEAFRRGRLEIEDLAVQAVGLVADPDPGERWRVDERGRGDVALHIASLMKGKGTVVATAPRESDMKRIAERARRLPLCNVTTRLWSGKGDVGKAASFDGVVVEPESSAIGTWRRRPEARYWFDPAAIAGFARGQSSALAAGARSVKPGGLLIYVCPTQTREETQTIIDGFLERRTDFRLDPFLHPLVASDRPTSGILHITSEESGGDALFIARLVRGG
jgi:16S rRNA (cytosine967-C5)-methyltransferase